MDEEDIKRMVVETLVQVNLMIDTITEEAMKASILPLHLRLHDGSWALAPMLQTKAQLLATLVILNRHTGTANGTRGKD